MAATLLYLVRHGKAEGSHPQGDRHRALSAEGRRRIEALVPQLAARSQGCDLALSSPYLRAVQTRDLFAKALGTTRTETSSSLLPESDPEDALGELVTWEAQGITRIAVFTHNPFVTHLAHWLLQGPDADLVFHTPTILALRFDNGLAPGTGTPLWTLHP